VTVCASSGDDGSAPDNLGRARVEFPGSSPFVLSCGGTSLVVSGQQKYEKVWNTRRATAGDGGASGGGLSDFVDKPIWQPKRILPATLPPRAEPLFEGRGLPDVAALSDCSYQIFYRGKHVNNVGGTSAASPLWAGLVARLNQGLGKPIGFINPLLYANVNLQRTFNDITSGDNGLNGATGYSAARGWDPCTGWGTPNGTKLFHALQD
jgi:kumamolisin